MTSWQNGNNQTPARLLWRWQVISSLHMEILGLPLSSLILGGLSFELQVSRLYKNISALSFWCDTVSKGTMKNLLSKILEIFQDYIIAHKNMTISYILCPQSNWDLGNLMLRLRFQALWGQTACFAILNS